VLLEKKGKVMASHSVVKHMVTNSFYGFPGQSKLASNAKPQFTISLSRPYRAIPDHNKNAQATSNTAPAARVTLIS
jgi:hypothetical protein